MRVPHSPALLCCCVVRTARVCSMTGGGRFAVARWQVTAVQAWVSERGFQLAVVLAGGGQGVLFPFDACQQFPRTAPGFCPSPDHGTFETLATAYVAGLTAYVGSWARAGSSSFPSARFPMPPGETQSLEPFWESRQGCGWQEGGEARRE